ncbi:hypothetical protein CDS [Bradyrhizobium sp.]|nr:hypothetical protein CDS [Bradyrhizobium sp.]
MSGAGSSYPRQTNFLRRGGIRKTSSNSPQISDIARKT